MADSSERKAFDFNPVTKKARIKGSSTRNPAGGKVSRTGKFEFNVDGTEVLVGVAKGLALDETNFSAAFGALESEGLIAVYPVPSTEVSAEWVRFNKQKRFARIHLATVFAQFSELRPTASRMCPVSADVDAKGRPCVIISMTASYVKPQPTGNKKTDSAQKTEGASK